MVTVRCAHYIRISPAMLEAIVSCRLTSTQIRIVLVLLDRVSQALTLEHFGQRRGPPTIRISLNALAEAANARPSGQFRAAVKQLAGWGVIMIAQPSRGRRPPEYRVQRDPSRWDVPAREPAHKRASDSASARHK